MENSLGKDSRELKYWKEISIGHNINIDIYDIKMNLDSNKINFIGDHRIFDKDIFPIENGNRRVKLYKIPISFLNLNKSDLYGSNYDSIVKKARILFGLELCPNETGFLLAIQYGFSFTKNMDLVIMSNVIPLPYNSENFSDKFKKHGTLLRIKSKNDQLEVISFDKNSTLTSETVLIFCGE